MMEKKKILIVDDEKDVLTLLEVRLTYEGYIVLKAENGKDAIKIAKEICPDLIILDILMPNMDGATAAGILKDDPTTKNIPIIFLSCLITKNGGKDKKVIKGKHYIAKPYDPDELVTTIRKLIK